MLTIKNSFKKLATATALAASLSLASGAMAAQADSTNSTPQTSITEKKPLVQLVDFNLGDGYDYVKAQTAVVKRSYIPPRKRYPVIHDKKTAFKASDGVAVIWMHERNVPMDSQIAGIINRGYKIQIALGAPEGEAFAAINARDYIELKEFNRSDNPRSLFAITLMKIYEREIGQPDPELAQIMQQLYTQMTQQAQYSLD